MKTRDIQTSNGKLKVSALGLGCMGMSDFYGQRDDAESLARAWLLHRGEDIVPIAGTKRRKYLDENAKSVEITLSPADMTLIRSVTEGAAIAGARDPAAMISSVNG